MLNQQPIFINALARGGSNIIMNLLLSHPDVCISSGETHKVFKGTKWDSFSRRIKKRVCYDFLIRFLTSQNLMGADFYQERKEISPFLERYIDKILYSGRFTAILKTHNYYKSEDVVYTKEDLEKCRLLTKGLNGISFTAKLFKKMYPDAVFFGLVRNGLAICEGFTRRGVGVERAGEIYKSVVEKIIFNSRELSDYHLVKYEDMVQDPYEFMKKIYTYAKLDVDKVNKVRLQSKKIMGTDGKRRSLKGEDRQLFWYNPSELNKIIKPNINKNQIKQLNPEIKNKFLLIAGETMEKLNYTTNV